MTSQPVFSSQHGPHPGLERLVRRHRRCVWRQPAHAGSLQAWRRFRAWYRPDRDLILDSGCGTGASSAELAHRAPTALVLGVDRSAARLARHPRELPENVLLLRARAEDFWRLLAASGIHPARHYLLYPNPWPKPRHVGRRWPGHPAFPALVNLGGRIELRCNWRPYADEFRVAARLCGTSVGPVVSCNPKWPLSPFERKYRDSGHALYRLVVVSSDGSGGQVHADGKVESGGENL